MSLPLSRRSLLGAAGAAAGTLLLPGRTAAAAGFRFSHPGILHSRADLDRMRAAVAARRQPQYAGFLALAADPGSSYGYRIQNTGQIASWGRGPSNFMSQAVADSDAVYQNALMWYVTGDVRHADTARDILDAWATTLTAITGADGQLGTGLQAFKFVNAAEILRHGGYQGWPEADIARSAGSFRSVWYRSLSGHALFANGNWDNCAVQTAMAVAIFCEDRVLFEESVRYAVAGAGNGRITFRAVGATGQGQESGRDQAHEQLAMAMTADVAQVAWNQGVDLYAWAGNRILASCEYDARYNLGYDVPFEAGLDRTGKYLKTAVSPTGRGALQPTYELVYGHYAGLLGLPAPYTRQVLFRGPEGARYVEGQDTDEPSWGTLTFARDAAVPGPAAAPPAAPSGLTASATGDAVTLSWVGSVEPVSATGAQRYAVRRSSTPDGPYRTVATGLSTAGWTDRAVRPGSVHHYTVSAANAVGESAASLPLAVSAGLPAPWASRDVGAVRLAGGTAFDGERFLVEAGGADIGGTADSFRFTYLTLPGDGTVTARLVYPVSSQYAKVGVMVRAGLDAGAPHAAMLVQGLPLVAWSGVWTTRAARGATTSGTGSTPVPPSQQQTLTVGAGFPISSLGTLPASATPLPAPYVEAASDGYRLRMPYWVRLERRGATLSGAISPDGHHWTSVGSARLTLPGTVYAGLATCSCLETPDGYARTGTAAFDNVSIRTAAGGWSAGPPRSVPGGVSLVDNPAAVELAVSDLDLSARYTVRRADASGGPSRVIATGAGPVGFGVRARYVDATGVPGRRYRYTVARTNGDGGGPPSGPVTATMPVPPAPAVTSAATAFANRGVPFGYLIAGSGVPYRFGATGLPAGLNLDAGTGRLHGVPGATGTYRIGLTATNRTGTATGTLTLTVGDPPPAPWAYTDIGDYVLDERQLGIHGVAAVRVPGITSYRTGVFTVRGAGSDLNVNGQGMTGHYAHRSVTGDTVLTARIATRANAGTADRVGLVMSKSLSPFDQLAGAIVTSTGAGGAGVQQLLLRPKVAAGTTVTAGPATGAVPVWLRLTRRGTTFTAESSPDGATWTTIGQGAIASFGDAPYQVGLMVCSRVDAVLDTTTFDHVTVKSLDTLS